MAPGTARSEVKYKHDSSSLSKGCRHWVSLSRNGSRNKSPHFPHVPSSKSTSMKQGRSASHCDGRQSPKILLLVRPDQAARHFADMTANRELIHTRFATQKMAVLTCEGRKPKDAEASSRHQPAPDPMDAYRLDQHFIMNSP